VLVALPVRAVCHPCALRPLLGDCRAPDGRGSSVAFLFGRICLWYVCADSLTLVLVAVPVGVGGHIFASVARLGDPLALDGRGRAFLLLMSRCCGFPAPFAYVNRAFNDPLLLLWQLVEEIGARYLFNAVDGDRVMLQWFL